MGSNSENIRGSRAASGARAAEGADARVNVRQAFAGCTLAFFGLAVVRIWIQCNLYGNYVLSDAGLVSVVINFVRIAFTVLLVLCALRGLLGPRFAKALEWFSVTAMTLGSVLFFLNGTLGSDAVLYAACTCAGLGIVWGGGMWMAFYLRLRPKTALLCALGSLALGSLGGLVMGVARGFPFGESIALPFGMQLLHQGGVVVLCAVWAWAVLGRGTVVSSATLWRFEVIAASAGVVLMATLEWWGLAGGAALVSIANTMTLGILWVICYDVARHSPWNSYAVLGACWAVFLLAREVGRWGILVFAPQSSLMTLLAALMVCALSVSIAVLLGDNVPRTRALLAGFPEDEAGEAEVAGAGSSRAENATAATDGVAGQGSCPHAGGEGTAGELADASESRADELAATAATGRANGVSTAAFSQVEAAAATAPAPDEDSISRLIATFGLTHREAEVALLMAQGQSKAAIAEAFVLSENTVRGYAKNAYAKMNVHNKRELQQVIREAR